MEEILIKSGILILVVHLVWEIEEVLGKINKEGAGDGGHVCLSSVRDFMQDVSLGKELEVLR